MLITTTTTWDQVATFTYKSLRQVWVFDNFLGL